MTIAKLRADDFASLPFDAQLEFFRQKLDIPTETWRDLIGAAHDRAFTVAGVTSADMLADIHGEVERAIAGGMTIEEFQARFDDIATKHGWTGWSEASDAKKAWRARVVYETNLSTSYAAGRWKYLRENTDEMPYWRYRHSDNVMHPRPAHLAIDGLILRADDPWWSTNYPPNGWGCRCYVEGVNDAAIKAQHWSVGEAPASVADDGWGYAPGESVAEDLARLIETKSQQWPPEIRSGFLSSLIDYIASGASSVLSTIGGFIRNLFGG